MGQQERKQKEKEERAEKKRKKKEKGEKKEREKKRRRLNMIGFSDTEQSDKEETEPTMYHRVHLCPMRQACTQKRSCTFAHNEKELMGIGEAKKLYDLKHRRHTSGPFDPLALRNQ